MALSDLIVTNNIDIITLELYLCSEINQINYYVSISKN